MEPITITLPNVADITGLDVMNAKAGGHFAAQGLDATLIGTSTGVAAMQQLVVGRCQFLRGGAVDLIKAVARQNVPVLSIGDPEHTVTHVLLSSPDRPIREAAMLKGKRIGVFAVGSTFDNYLDLMLRRAGLPPDAVERQSVGGNPAIFALVRLGRLDGVILTYESAFALLGHDQGEAAVALPISDAVTMPGRCYQTTRTIVEQRPDLALAFTRAMAASVREIVASPDEALYARCAVAFDIPATRTMAQNLAIMQWMAKTWLADGRAELLRNPEARWRAGVTEMADAGIATVPAATELFTNRFVEQALPR